MWFNFDNISTHHLSPSDNFLSDEVSGINNAILFIICIIIKEDMLSVVVCLINQKDFGCFSMKIVLFPVGVVILNGH